MGACGSAQPGPVPSAKTSPASAGASRPVRSATPSPASVRPVPVDCRRIHCVALTFDAGPGPDTARLLDVLRAKGVNATFFLLGKNTLARPALVRREASEGHELANHTWTHKHLTEASAEEIRHELVLLQERVKELTGRTPTLMRPPQGLTNSRVAEVCRSLGLAQILWTVTAKDYRDHDPEVITSRVLQGAGTRPHGGPSTTSCCASAPRRAGHRSGRVLRQRRATVVARPGRAPGARTRQGREAGGWRRCRRRAGPARTSRALRQVSISGAAADYPVPDGAPWPRRTRRFGRLPPEMAWSSSAGQRGAPTPLRPGGTPMPQKAAAVPGPPKSGPPLSRSGAAQAT
ncbi:MULTISPECIES: polysaccharide deacetylase family protein [unclassified Streptomyces]|uniref:polysaccharide deacetylase family protein n=1 Tax=unclassified Streptomyces TaxID=2593676 RepID=UPI002E329963|nr:MULTISPECIES: polysaccharide deacetylase family protein [unclassified Streptomyces]